MLDLRFDSIPSGFLVQHDTGGYVFRIDSFRANRLLPADSTLKQSTEDQQGS